MSLQDAHIIDQLAHDPATDEVVLTMTESRPWDGSDQRLLELQEKVNTYLCFALDGEMLEQLPQLAGKKIRLHIECVDQPDPKTGHFLGLIEHQIGFQEIKLSLCLVPDLVATPAKGDCCGGGNCGGHCDCEEPPPADTPASSQRRSGCCGGEAQCGHS